MAVSSSSLKAFPSLSLHISKLKTLLHTLFLSQFLAKAKSILTQIIKMRNRNRIRKKLFLGSFRLHYNWCSAHVVPVPSPVVEFGHVYYDSTWMSNGEEEEAAAAEVGLSGYLHWLEVGEKGKGKGGVDDGGNDVDRLADMFIARFHEKFRLEKQESYRRFQEMLARSV